MLFQVETGEGLPDATSYVSVEYADTHISENFPDDTQWDSKTVSQKQRLLMGATSFVDSLLKWQSVLFLLTQSLAWPRDEFKDSEGRTITAGEVPTKIEIAVINIALESVTSDIFDEGVVLDSQKYGSSSEFYSGPQRDGGNVIVERIVRDFKHSGYGRAYSSLVELQRA